MRHRDRRRRRIGDVTAGRRREEVEWVAIRVPRSRLPHPEVQMRRWHGATAGHTNRADRRARRQDVAAMNRHRREVQVRQVEPPVGGALGDGEPGRADDAGESHRSAHRRNDSAPHARADVDPSVLAAGVRIRAVSVRREHGTRDGPPPAAGSESVRREELKGRDKRADEGDGSHVSDRRRRRRPHGHARSGPVADCGDPVRSVALLSRNVAVLSPQNARRLWPPAAVDKARASSSRMTWYGWHVLSERQERRPKFIPHADDTGPAHWESSPRDPDRARQEARQAPPRAHSPTDLPSQLRVGGHRSAVVRDGLGLPSSASWRARNRHAFPLRLAAPRGRHPCKQ
ncbi:MAG: hypothetical protein QOF65_1109 [Thermoleophilaceae bacterium]|nr:hypothetical protein [Thermoleophilaceae bacterium]